MSDRRYYASEMKLASLDADAGRMGLDPQRLHEHEPRGDNDADLRGFEWYYLQRLCQLDLRTLRGHANAVWGVAYSPDGRRLASASRDKTVKVWDAATGKELLALKGHTDRVRSVAYSPDGCRLASASDDRTVKVWDAATGQPLLTLRGHGAWVHGVAFSPDGRLLASAGYDRTVKIWDATSITPQALVEREAQGLVQFLITQPLSPEDMSAAISRDATITEAVRRQALTWIEPFRRNHVRQLVESLFARPMPRAEVLAALRADASLNERVRQEALSLAKTWPENAYALREASWGFLCQPGLDAAIYRWALRLAKAACHAAPDDDNSVFTLAVAYYRLGKYPEAIATLEKRLLGHASYGMDEAELYLLSLCHYRLGNAAKARDYFQRAEDSHPRYAANMPEAHFSRFRTEAEALLEKAVGTGRKPKEQTGGMVQIVCGAKYVKLVHEKTGKVLAIARISAQPALANALRVEDASQAALTRGVLAVDDGCKAQQWKFEQDGNYYKIVNRKSGKVLDVQRNRTEPGVAIIEYDDEDQDNQRWSWEGSGKVGRLRSKSSTLVLDVRDDGAVIQRKADEKAKAQLWRVVAIEK
jgi:tetratricopeptide (TPR) repeat protein